MRVDITEDERWPTLGITPNRLLGDYEIPTKLFQKWQRAFKRLDDVEKEVYEHLHKSESWKGIG